MKKYLLSIFFLFSFVACSDDNSSHDPNPDNSVKPESLKDGVTVISADSLAFVLFAPNKSTVHLIGDFNNWVISDEYKMNKDGDRFWNH